MELDLLIVVIVVFTYFLCRCKSEGLLNKPNSKQKHNMINQILINKELFYTPLENTKNKLPWIDAVIYEDIRSLIYKNQFDKNYLNDVFMQ